MLIDELRDQLKSLEPDIALINDFFKNNKIKETWQNLDEKSKQEDFWQDPEHIQIMKKSQRLKELIEQYDQIINSYNEDVELIELFSDNEEELKKLRGEIRHLEKNIRLLKISLLMGKPEDSSNCFVSINSGAGGTESQDWASMLLRMYIRFCERENLKVATIDYQGGDEAGIKSATLFIKGKNPYGLLKAEHGVHRLVRISPFDANKRRHTSFAAVFVTPEVKDKKVEIKDEDLRIDTYRAGGAGGQHVNKTDSAVRITHLPTKIVVQCQNERSQMQNKQVAMKMLMAKLVEKQKEEKRTKEASVEKKKIEWGSQIRSYVLHPYKMVKDLRTEHESPQPDLVLDGDIMPFIESYLVKFSGYET